MESDFKISLRAARINAGYTQEAAAAEIGVAKCTLHSWETGKSAPSVNTFRALCEMYHTPAELIFMPEKVN